MKLAIIATLAVGAFSALFVEECTQPLEVKCADEITSAYNTCKEAAQEKGKDVAADLQCMKYYSSMSLDCWPCICKVSKDNNLNIKGCS